MSFLNRRERRLAERNSKRGITNNTKTVDFPKPLDTFIVFNSVDEILHSILKGELSYKGDTPVFRDNSGKHDAEIIPSVLSWVEVWDKVKENGIGIEHIETKNMLQILQRLYNNELIKHDEIYAAQNDFNKLRKFYDSLPMPQREIIKAIAIQYDAELKLKQEKENGL